MEELVKKLYTNVGWPYAFGGVDRLYNGLKKMGHDISKYRIKKILQSVPSYTLHKQSRKKFRRRPIMVSRPGLYLNCDLLEYSDLSKSNKKYRYLLVCQDMFSRYVYTEFLKNKKGESVANKLKSILEKTHHNYKYMQSDEGGEFFNNKVKKLLDNYGIHHYHTFNRETKAALVERFLKTYKGVLYRLLTEKNTTQFLKYHDKIISSYNNRRHKGLKNRTPHYVHFLANRRKIKLIAKEIWAIKTKNYGVKISDTKKKKGINTGNRLKVGSHVRLVLASVTQSKFKKGYDQQNTQEIFRIHTVKKNTQPVTYKLKDLSGKIIEGSFYKQELIETTKPEFFLIRKILKSKTIKNKKQYLVSWLGYDDSFNSWVGSDAIYNFKK